MAWVIFLVHLTLIISLSFMFWKKHWRSYAIFWPALGVKLTAGICLGLLYTYYFPVADTFVYFADGARLASVAKADFNSYLRLILFDEGIESSGVILQEPRALFLSKVTSLFNLLTVDNYWAIGLYYSFLSFLASWYLVMVLGRNVPFSFVPAFLAFLFLPSVVLWSSGLLKESLAMGAFFFLAALFIKYCFERRIPVWHGIAAVLGFWLFWNLKYYYAGVFMSVVATSLIYARVVEPRVRLSALMQVVVWLAILFLPVLAVSFLHPNFHLDRLLGVVVLNNAAYNDLSEPGEYVKFYDLRADPLRFLINVPWALFSGLFRPFLWETTSVIQVAQGIENTSLLLLSAAAGFRKRGSFPGHSRLLIITMVIFVIITAVLITLSAPNFGTLSRYRIGYISVFTFIILYRNPVLVYLQRRFAGLSVIEGKS